MGSGGEEHDYSLDYLTFVALEDCVFTLKIGSSVSTANLTSISYSLDEGSTWIDTNNVNSTEIVITTPTIQSGRKVLWKGSCGGTASGLNPTVNSSIFSSTGAFNVQGNLQSLRSDNFIQDKAAGVFGYVGLFYNCSNLINAKNLIMPATNIQNYTYYWFFRGCTGLITSPKIIPANTKSGSHGLMFSGCTSLISAPELPQTTLESSCYLSMFANCTSLTTAPELPAGILKSTCYYSMFDGCTNLNYIKCLATDISASNSMSNWLRNVSATGTFVKKAGVTIPSGESGIPNGWTVIEEP